MVGDRATLRACEKKQESATVQALQLASAGCAVLCGIGKVAGKQCILPQAPYYQL